MAASSTNILVFGATGLIGKYITEAVIKEKSSFGKLVLVVEAQSPKLINTIKAVSASSPLNQPSTQKALTSNTSAPTMSKSMWAMCLPRKMYSKHTNHTTP